MSSREIRKRLSRRNTQRLRRTRLNNPIGSLIRPELKVRSAFARLVDLPHHPWNLEAVEDVNVLTHHIRLVGASRTKFLEEHEFFSGLRVLQCNGGLIPPFGDAAVRVDVDKVEGCAGPVLGDIGVGKFVTAAWIESVRQYLRCRRGESYRWR
jgi:hypothetical protein